MASHGHPTDSLQRVRFNADDWFCIRDVDRLSPFLMSVVSGFDHWMFLSSRGGLTAGRVDAERCLFAYETDDRLHRAHHSGPFTEITRQIDGASHSWQPMAAEVPESTDRHLYKNTTGDAVMFESIHRDWGLTFQATWQSSDRFGFVRTSRLINSSGAPVSLRIIDGLQDIMPPGVVLRAQQSMSNLVNAYKRSELAEGVAFGIYSLEAQLSDKAEPAEALKATTVWAHGLPEAQCYLSLEEAREAKPPQRLRTGRPGAFVLAADCIVDDDLSWQIIADVDQSQAQVANKLFAVTHDNLASAIADDIRRGHEVLISNVARSDGLQNTNDGTVDAHHFANVLFNNMRGGLFSSGYSIRRDDLLDFLTERNIDCVKRNGGRLSQLPEQTDLHTLLTLADETPDPNLTRLALEYLPISFSRRHGDPSRPWNRFEILVRDASGRLKLTYQGNWRDIFQNWEALCFSCPEFFESIIAKFVNASTADGYNPYRLTRSGIEWEVPEPDDPWGNIGYWGDHQVIYLLRLLEASRDFHPNKLQTLLQREVFSYAEVPYRLAPIAELLNDPRNSIRFDATLNEEIEARAERIGSDGKLLCNSSGDVLHVNLLEKLVVTALAKLSNLVVDGGIWMNTQRPEWNDANNALAGYGLSMVTLSYLRRYIVFVGDLIASLGDTQTRMSTEVVEWMTGLIAVAERYSPQQKLSAGQRRAFVEELGQIYDQYRQKVYQRGLSGMTTVSTQVVSQLFDAFFGHLESTIAANRRDDGLYHAYNLVEFTGNAARVNHLYEMLEGQVAALSSGQLSPTEAIELVDSLFDSPIYRPDQNSFMLYPARELPRLLDKGVLTESQWQSNLLIKHLVAAEDTSIISVDVHHTVRFSSDFSGASDLKAALTALKEGPAEELGQLAAVHEAETLALYEEVYQHRAFTGRSGTMYAYEGIGSIYWHMVAKLLLAVQEIYFDAVRQAADEAIVHALAARYYRVRAGLGFTKSPENYGAFPPDPYSHTPAHRGAQQPGMTGQVKEEILTRRGELGLLIENGGLHIRPSLLRRSEFRAEERPWRVFDGQGRPKTIALPADSLGFTFCLLPVIYRLSDGPSGWEVTRRDDSTIIGAGTQLPAALSQEIFRHSGGLKRLLLQLNESQLAPQLDI